MAKVIVKNKMSRFFMVHCVYSLRAAQNCEFGATKVVIHPSVELDALRLYISRRLDLTLRRFDRSKL